MKLKTVKTTIRRDYCGEYVVRLHVKGTHQAGANYYTDDKADALGTARHMEATALFNQCIETIVTRRFGPRCSVERVTAQILAVDNVKRLVN